MSVFNTTDARLADRCARALSGQKTITETFDTPTGSETITGKVQSVVDDRQASPKRWGITIIPEFPPTKA